MKSVVAMIGGFRWIFPQPVADWREFWHEGYQIKRDRHDWRFSLEFFPVGDGLSLVLARSRSNQSLIAMIGDFRWEFFPSGRRVIASFRKIVIQ